MIPQGLASGIVWNGRIGGNLDWQRRGQAISIGPRVLGMNLPRRLKEIVSTMVIIGRFLHVDYQSVTYTRWAKRLKALRNGDIKKNKGRRMQCFKNNVWCEFCYGVVHREFWKALEI